MDNTITAKELRLQFPSISKRLQNGESFVVIYHSKPLCEIHPFIKNARSKKLDVDFLRRVSFTSDKSAVQLVREERTR